MSIRAWGLVWALAPMAAVWTAPASVADRITLRDGTVVLGQVLAPNERGKLVVMVRRDWARRHVPKRLSAWEEVSRREVERARAERLRRLEAWRRDRGRDGEETDPLLRRLDTAIERLRSDPAESVLLIVALDPREVVKLERQPPEVARLLRLGWRAGFEDVETMTPDELRPALEGRNLPVRGEAAVAVDDLLPLAPEPEARWRLRRAASELLADRSGWFVRYGDTILADTAEGAARLDPGALLGGLGQLRSLVRELTGESTTPDPLPARLQALAERGRVGAVVTRLEIGPDLASVTVTAEMWVHLGPGPEGWRAAGQRSATVQTDQVAANAGAALEADPRVRSAFQVVENLGLGQITPEIKQRALSVGAATQQALSRVREQAHADLEALAVDLER
ncbi:MAG: hypothetical protein KatS3mg108_2262 [Isosphaeraceae bacterium]|jgi:hypothetical protein|nr:MAG: hypothetical protein KatS3mg108_2262 [Isosphaeraceae bacterium]